MLKGIRQLISAALVLVMVMALALPASGALAASGYAPTDVESSGARVRNIERAAGAISGDTLVDGEQMCIRDRPQGAARVSRACSAAAVCWTSW